MLAVVLVRTEVRNIVPGLKDTELAVVLSRSTARWRRVTTEPVLQEKRSLPSGRFIIMQFAYRRIEAFEYDYNNGL